MATTVVFSVAFAAMRLTTDRWGDWFLCLAFVLLLLPPLAIVFRRNEMRVFWTGSALFGWVYLLDVRATLLNMLYRNHSYGFLTNDLAYSFSHRTGLDYANMNVCLHSLLSLVVAVLGGTLSHFCFRRRGETVGEGGWGRVFEPPAVV